MAPTSHTEEQLLLDKEQRYCTQARCLTGCPCPPKMMTWSFSKMFFDPWFYLPMFPTMALFLHFSPLFLNHWLVGIIACVVFFIVGVFFLHAFTMVMASLAILISDAWHNRQVIRAYISRMHYGAIHESVACWERMEKRKSQKKKKTE